MRFAQADVIVPRGQLEKAAFMSSEHAEIKMSAKYASRFIADRRVVTVVETTATNDLRTIAVTADHDNQWEIELESWSVPCVALLDDLVCVWGGSCLFALRRGRPAMVIDIDDELRAVYNVGGRLCIVGELGVVLYDLEANVVVDRWAAENTLRDSWWAGSKLFLAICGRNDPVVLEPSSNALVVR